MAQVGSQTLGRGIRILELLAQSGEPQSIDSVARGLDVHRSVAYRLVRTLEEHGLVARDAAGQLVLGPGLAALAVHVERDLQQAAVTELGSCADALEMTCLIALMMDAQNAVTLVSVSPRRSGAVISYRPGHRHPLTRGAPGKAILLGLPPTAWPADISPALRSELSQARVDGYATSQGEVVSSLRAVAVPLPLPDRQPASLAAIHVEFPHPPAEIAAQLEHTRDRIVRTLVA